MNGLNAANLKDIKYIIWDWNGTLWDDTWLCLEIINQILLEEGRSVIDLAYFRNAIDFPIIRLYQRLQLAKTEESPEFLRLSHLFISRYELRRMECQLYPGIRKLLAAQHGIARSQAILSAYKQDTLDSLVEAANIRPCFQSVAGQNNIYGRSKCQRGSALMQSLGWDPSQTLIIGDTLHDAEVAQALGTHCLLVSYGYHSPERLAACSAAQVTSPAALYEFLTAE